MKPQYDSDKLKSCRGSRQPRSQGACCGCRITEPFVNNQITGFQKVEEKKKKKNPSCRIKVSILESPPQLRGA